MLLVQDLSQVRKLEADLQRIEKDAAVGRMAAGVAHELRNPLSSIKGLALLLKSRTDLQGGGDTEAAGLLIDEVVGRLLTVAQRQGAIFVEVRRFADPPDQVSS